MLEVSADRIDSRWPKLRSDTETPLALASTVASGAWGCWGGGMMRSRCVGTGAASGGESGVVAGGIGGALFEAGRSEVVEPRRAEREGGDVLSGEGAEAADAANPPRAANR